MTEIKMPLENRLNFAQHQLVETGLIFVGDD